MVVFHIPIESWIVYLVVLLIGTFVLSVINGDPKKGSLFPLYITLAVIYVIFLMSFGIFIDNWLEIYGNPPSYYNTGSIGSLMAGALMMSVMVHAMILKMIIKKIGGL